MYSREGLKILQCVHHSQYKIAPKCTYTMYEYILRIHFVVPICMQIKDSALVREIDLHTVTLSAVALSTESK